MNIEVKDLDGATLVALNGDVDGSSAPQAQARILPLIGPGCRILLDMSGVSYMSSAGLRMLLSTYRQLAAKDGRMVLAGLSDDIADTMSVTGFLKFFTTSPSVEAGLAALRQTGATAAA